MMLLQMFLLKMDSLMASTVLQLKQAQLTLTGVKKSSKRR